MFCLDNYLSMSEWERNALYWYRIVRKWKFQKIFSFIFKYLKIKNQLNTVDKTGTLVILRIYVLTLKAVHED